MDQGTSSVSDGAGAVSDTTPSTGTSACASDGLLPDGQLAVQDVTSLPAESADVSGGVSADAGVPAESADLSGGVSADAGRRSTSRVRRSQWRCVSYQVVLWQVTTRTI